MTMRTPALSLLILLLSACQSVMEPGDAALELQTQGSEFVISPTEESASVPFTVTNHGPASVWIARCGDRLMAALDRREGGKWVQYSGDGCLMNTLTGPVELGAGEVLQGARGVVDPGQYRLRIGVSAAGQIGWDRASNGFIVR
jgi:hypothetical protein